MPFQTGRAQPFRTHGYLSQPYRIRLTEGWLTTLHYTHNYVRTMLVVIFIML